MLHLVWRWDVPERADKWHQRWLFCRLGRLIPELQVLLDPPGLFKEVKPLQNWVVNFSCDMLQIGRPQPLGKGTRSLLMNLRDTVLSCTV